MQMLSKSSPNQRPKLYFLYFVINNCFQFKIHYHILGYERAAHWSFN